MIPKYIRLKEIINEKISKGVYPIGSKLPTEMQLAAEFNVSRSTVRQTLELLKDDGVISKHWGSGNTVLSKNNSVRKNVVKIILPEKFYPFADNLIEDIEAVLLKEGLKPDICETHNSVNSERAYLSEMLNDAYGGLIIIPTHSSISSTNADMLQLLLKRQVPIIFINSAPNVIYNPTIVAADNYTRGYHMARNFINEGHKKIGGIFLHDDVASTSAYSGFVDAIRDANLEIIDQCFLFVNSVDFSGMCTRTNDTINHFLKIAYQDASVIYMDDSSLYSEGSLPVYRSTLQPTKSFGKEAAKAFIELKKNGNSKSVTIPYK